MCSPDGANSIQYRAWHNAHYDDNNMYGGVTFIGDFVNVDLSTYKFKRAFFRHDRRTTPKFGTHVRIATLTLKKN